MVLFTIESMQNDFCTEVVFCIQFIKVLFIIAAGVHLYCDHLLAGMVCLCHWICTAVLRLCSEVEDACVGSTT